MFDLDDPTQRLCAGTYEHDPRAAVAEIGLPIDGGDPLEVLHERAVQILGLVRQRRAESPSGPQRAKFRGMGRHLDAAVHALARAIERAKQ